MKLEKQLKMFEKINVKNECSDSKKVLKSSFSLSTGEKRLDTGIKHSIPEIESKNDLKSQASNHMIIDKSLLNQEMPLLQQSHLVKQTKDVFVGNSDTELFSSVDEKKVVDSMEYEDFIAQLITQNEQQTQQDSQKLKSCEINQNMEEKKRTMSYSEFLGMFKPPPKVEDSKLSEVETQAEKSPIPIIETKKEIKYKSVASYFSKTEKMSDEKKNCTTVTVIAEIHSPSQAMSETKQTKACTMKLPRKTETCLTSSNDGKNEIIFLSSETITEVQAHSGNKSLTTKRRNNETVDLPVQTHKKQKIETQSEISNKQNMETLSENSEIQIVETPLEKCGNLKDQPHSKVFCTVKSSSNCGNTMPGKETMSKTSLEHANGEVTQTLQSLTVKTSQSTLCFGKSGFSLVKAVEANKDIPAEDKSHLETKNENKGATRRLSSRRNLTNRENTKGNIHKENYVKDGQCEEKNESQDKRQQLGQSDLLAGSQLLTQKNVQEETDTSVEIVEQNNVETCGLRRSARLTRSINTVKDLNVVEINSDSDEDVSSSKKKRGRQTGTPKTFSESGNSKGSCSKITAGKLAPVFTLMKSKQQMERSPTPPIDPEQDRLRREFLMSGIPDELKRQIATTANSNVLLDYPPFPRVSHVQQIQEESCLSVEVITPRVTCTFDEEYFESIHSTPPMWTNLGWEHIPTNKSLHKDVFQNFTSNSQFLDSQLDLLLKELQSNDVKFPFRRTYTNLHSKIATLEVPSCEIAESKVANADSSDDVVIVDDDVMVVDGSSPISEGLVLKYSSEPKASLWSDLHQPDSSENIIGNTKAIKQLKHWLEEWKVLVEQQERKACKISKNASKKKGKGGWTDNSDFTDSEEEEMTLCNSVLITGPHGVGKTASVYALAKDLGYKVFEVNSSSLRSGKQLLTQLEEATQSHRVAQNKTKSPVFLDTPPAGTLSTKKEETGKEIKHMLKQKPAASVNLGFANLFRKATPKTEDANNPSCKPMKGNQLKRTLLVPENKSKSEESKKKSVKPSNLKVSESIPTKTNRGKKNQVKEEIPITNIKKHNKDEIRGAGIKKQKGTCGQQLHSSGAGLKPQMNGDCNVTSGSLNLTSASLILFDEVDVIFEEDKGFLTTVQHFMESTKIPIVLTSTDLSFHLQLHARHDHISFLRPPLNSAASFLSTVCLAHGVRVDYQSVLNALFHMGGDVRRCLLYLQFWCESAGGLVQIEKRVDPDFWPADSVAVSGCLDAVKLNKGNPEKTFGSKIVTSDDSSDREFISLRPPKKKARRVMSDEDDSSHDSTTIIQDNITKSVIKKSKYGEADLSLPTSRSKQMKVKYGKKENGTVELFRQIDELPLLHLRLEESLLGFHSWEMSATAVMDFIKAPTLSCFGLEQAGQVSSIISQALSIDAIYHVVLHCLSLPRTDIQITQLTLSDKQKAPMPQIISTKKSRKRIIQGDWLNSDSSDEDLDKVNNVMQVLTKDDENCHKNNLKHEETVSFKPRPEEGLSGKCKNKEFGTESKCKKTCSKLMVSVLSEFARFYDNLSVIDQLETWPTLAAHTGNGIKLIPGLSDDEKHSKLENSYLEDKLHQIGAPVRVLAARKFCSCIGDHVDSFKRCGHTNSDGAVNRPECNDNGAQDGTCDMADWPEEFHLPVQKVLPDLWKIANKAQSQSEPAVKNVIKCLGPAVYSSKPSLHLDYMPYLREICRTENERHLAKSQRRFHHYLDNIGLGLKDSTIASLTSTFVVTSGEDCSDTV